MASVKLRCPSGLEIQEEWHDEITVLDVLKYQDLPFSYPVFDELLRGIGIVETFEEYMDWNSRDRDQRTEYEVLATLQTGYKLLDQTEGRQISNWEDPGFLRPDHVYEIRRH